MSLAGASSLALLAGVLGNATVVDWAVGSRGELGGGYIPVNAAADALPAMQAILDLRGGMRLRSPSETLILRTGPRLYGLFPNSVGIDRPLLFYTLDGNYVVRLSPRWTSSLRLSSGIGELSYATLSQVFLPGTGAAATAVIPLAIAALQYDNTWLTSRRNSLTVSAGANGQRWLSSDAPGTDAPIPNFSAWTLAVTDSYRVTKDHSLSLSLGSDWLLGNTTSDFVTLRGWAGWTWQTDAQSTFGVRGGADFVHSLEESRNRWLPAASVDYATRGGDAQHRRWTLHYAGGVRGFFDRFNFTYRPQGFVQFDATIDWDRHWQSGAALFASTSITSEPVAQGFYETFVGLDLPQRYRASTQLDLLFGLRNLLRGPHLSSLDSDSFQGQFIGYIGFDWTDGTDALHGQFAR
ncbi:MAG TPA: hypothetical protein VLC09_02370 [Polyangiaceae bacterium]|nr:hypothetical protein [Polyangiaceae bacterium]